MWTKKLKTSASYAIKIYIKRVRCSERMTSSKHGKEMEGCLNKGKRMYWLQSSCCTSHPFLPTSHGQDNPDPSKCSAAPQSLPPVTLPASRAAARCAQGQPCRSFTCFAVAKIPGLRHQQKLSLATSLMHWEAVCIQECLSGYDNSTCLLSCLGSLSVKDNFSAMVTTQ